MAYEHNLFAEFSQEHGSAQLLIRDRSTQKILRKRKITVVRPIADDQIIRRCINTEVFLKVSGGFRSQRRVQIKGPVLNENGEPCQDGIVAAQIQDAQPFHIQLVAVRIAVMLLRDSPLLGHLRTLRTVEAISVVVVWLAAVIFRSLYDVI